MEYQAITGQSNRRGFNLIEAAIVLGVVGLIIGGIWTASARFYESYKVNKTVEGVLTISRNIQNLISLSDSTQMGVDAGGNSTINSLLISAGVFPESWIYRGPASGTLNISPYGGDVWVTNQPAAAAFPRFNISLMDIPKSACVELVSKVSAIGDAANNRRSGSSNRTALGLIVINNTNQIVDFPISLDSAHSYCNISLNRVGFVFGYTRTN